MRFHSQSFFCALRTSAESGPAVAIRAMASFHVARSVPSFIHRHLMPASMSSLSTAMANRVSVSTASMRETISLRLAFVAAFAPVLHEGVEFFHAHVVDDVEGAVVGFVGGAFENHPGEVFVVEAVSLGAAAVSYGDDGVDRWQADFVTVVGGVAEPVERVKLFVCGARFIGICRSGRERLRPFG